MIFKNFASLQLAIQEVTKLADSYEEYAIYEPKEKSTFSNSQKPKNNKFNKSSYNRNEHYSKREYENKKEYSHKNDYNKKKESNNNNNQVENDIDNITNQFAQMKLYVCNRCNQKGHIAKFCVNEIAPENLKIIQQNNEHLNY